MNTRFLALTLTTTSILFGASISTDDPGDETGARTAESIRSLLRTSSKSKVQQEISAFESRSQRPGNFVNEPEQFFQLRPFTPYTFDLASLFGGSSPDRGGSSDKSDSRQADRSAAAASEDQTSRRKDSSPFANVIDDMNWSRSHDTPLLLSSMARWNGAPSFAIPDGAWGNNDHGKSRDGGASDKNRVDLPPVWGSDPSSQTIAGSHWGDVDKFDLDEGHHEGQMKAQANPEPGYLVLLGLGMVGLGWAHWRKQSSAQ